MGSSLFKTLLLFYSMTGKFFCLQRENSCPEMTLMMFDVTLKHKNVSIYEAHSIYSFRVFIQIKTKTEKCGSFYQNLQKEKKETSSV